MTVRQRSTATSRGPSGDAEGAQRCQLRRAGRPAHELALAERAHQEDAEAEFVGQRQDGSQFRWGDEASPFVTPGTRAISWAAGTLLDGLSREPPSSRWRRPDAALHEGGRRIS